MSHGKEAICVARFATVISASSFLKGPELQWWSIVPQRHNNNILHPEYEYTEARVQYGGATYTVLSAVTVHRTAATLYQVFFQMRTSQA